MNALRALAPGHPVAPARGPRQQGGRRGRAHGHARPYGSVFNRNLSRACLEAKCRRPLVDEDPPAPGEDSAIVVTYRHDKLNSGRPSAPHGPALGLRPRGVHHRLSRAPCPSPTSGIPQRILHALDGVDKKSARALAEELGIAPNVARARLGELESARKVVRFSDSGWRSRPKNAMGTRR